jgi:hypothetical protein
LSPWELIAIAEERIDLERKRHRERAWMIAHIIAGMGNLKRGYGVDRLFRDLCDEPQDDATKKKFAERRAAHEARKAKALASGGNSRKTSG